MKKQKNKEKIKKMKEVNEYLNKQNKIHENKKKRIYKLKKNKMWCGKFKKNYG